MGAARRARCGATAPAAGRGAADDPEPRRRPDGDLDPAAPAARCGAASGIPAAARGRAAGADGHGAAAAPPPPGMAPPAPQWGAPYGAVPPYPPGVGMSPPGPQASQYVPGRQTNGLAIASLVLGIA